MKKLFALMLSLVLLLSMAACKGETKEKNLDNTKNTETNVSGEEKNETTKIKIWYETQDAIGDAIREELASLAPEIEVSVERKDKMTEALKLVGNDPNSAPDMYFFAHDKVGVYAEMGILAPITDFVDESLVSNMIPMTVDACTYKGKIYELPMYFESLLFMYNKELMQTPPATTDDLLAYMKSNTKDGHYGFVEQHSTAYFSVGWIHAFDGFIIDSNAKSGLDNPNTIKALDYHKNFVPYMPIDGDYNTMTTLFKEGNADSTIGGPWLIPELKESGINYGIAPMPVVNEAGKAISPFAGVQGVCVLKVAEDKKEALAKVLEKLASKDMGMKLAERISAAPANTECYDEELVKSNEIIMALKDISNTAVPMPNVPEMDVMWAVTENLLAAVNKTGEDVEESAKKAGEEAKNQIEAMQ